MSHYSITRLLSVVALVLLIAGGFSVVQAQGGDRDGDGLPDTADSCPDVPGPRENMGCPWPDGDGDGVPDRDDQCPTQPGPGENGGCPVPDRDGDGVSDSTDQCPDLFGANDNHGCPWPDSDGDGVPDPQDQCPGQPGTAENGGCSAAPGDVPDESGGPGDPALLLPALPEEGACMVATLGAENVNIRMLPGTADGIIIIGGMDPQQLYPVVMSFETPEGLWWMLEQGGFVADWVTRQGGACALLPAVQLGGSWLFKGSFHWGSDKMQDFHFLVMFDNTGAMLGAWDVLPGEDGSLKITPGAIAGFDPQPDPPGEDVGFDPQPEPPGEEAGIIINWLPSGEEAGIVIVGGLPSDDEAGIIIHWLLPGAGEGIVIIGGLPSGEEAGIVIHGLPSGDEAGIIIDYMVGKGSAIPDDTSAFCDGSVIPAESMMGDGSVMPGEASVYFCDGSVMPSWLLPAIGGDSVMPSWLLPAVGGDSAMPSWLLPAMVFPDGGTALGCVPVGSDQMGDPIPTESQGDPIPTESGDPHAPGQLCSFTNGEVLAQCSVGPEQAFCVYSAYQG